MAPKYPINVDLINVDFDLIQFLVVLVHRYLCNDFVADNIVNLSC